MVLITPVIRAILLSSNVYATYKTLKPPPPSRRPSGGGPSVRATQIRKRNMKGCLSFWIVWACWSAVERAADSTVGILMPFYDEFKCLFFLFLFFSRSTGAESILLHVLRPMVRPHTKTIDSTLEFFALFGDLIAYVLLTPWVNVYGWWSGRRAATDNDSEESPINGQADEVQVVLEVRKTKPSAPLLPSKPLPDVPREDDELQRIALATQETKAVFEEIEIAQKRVRDWRQELNTKAKQKAADAISLRSQQSDAYSTKTRTRKNSETAETRTRPPRVPPNPVAIPFPSSAVPKPADDHHPRSRYRYYQPAPPPPQVPNNIPPSFVTDRSLRSTKHSGSTSSSILTADVSRPGASAQSSRTSLVNTPVDPFSNSEDTSYPPTSVPSRPQALAISSTHSLPTLHANQAATTSITPPRPSHNLFQSDPLIPHHSMHPLFDSNDPSFSPYPSITTFPGSYVFTPPMPTRTLPPEVQEFRPPVQPLETTDMGSLLVSDSGVSMAEERSTLLGPPPAYSDEEMAMLGQQNVPSKQSGKVRGMKQKLEGRQMANAIPEQNRVTTRSRGRALPKVASDTAVAESDMPPPQGVRGRRKIQMDENTAPSRKRPPSTSSASLRTKKSGTSSDASVNSISTLATHASGIATRKRPLSMNEGEGVIEEGDGDSGSEGSVRKKRKSTASDYIENPFGPGTDPEAELQYLLDELEDELTTPARPRTRRQRPTNYMKPVDESTDASEAEKGTDMAQPLPSARIEEARPRRKQAVGRTLETAPLETRSRRRK